MSDAGFWGNLLEPGERLLWTGRPRPRLHWRNWRLYAPAPVAATGLLAAALFARATVGPDPRLWLMAPGGLLVLIPLRQTWQQLRLYRATRYALTDRRALFFRVGPEGTRVRAHPLKHTIGPRVLATAPPSVTFLTHGTGPGGVFGFDYIPTHDRLLARVPQDANDERGRDADT